MNALGLVTGPDRDRIYIVALAGPGSDNPGDDDNLCLCLGDLIRNGMRLPNDADAALYVSVLAVIPQETEAQKLRRILSLDAFFASANARPM